MKVSPLPISGAENWTEQFAAAIRVQRQRVREFLSAQQERMCRAETELSEQLQRIAAELADDRRQTRQTREELSQRSGHLENQSAALEQMKIDLAARQAEWEKLYHQVIQQQQSFANQLKLQQDEFARRQQDLLQQQSAAVAADNQLIFERKKIETGRLELENRRTELDALQESMQNREAELELRQQELNARIVETENQRRRIVRELKTQHAAHLKEIEHRQLDLEQQAKADHEELKRQNVEDDESFRRRYEMAVDDLRELKAGNEELQEQLARARQSGGGNAGQISSSVLNWEVEKQRILAALEADFEEENENDREEKLKIEDVIRKTDLVINEKNREIGELRELLASQTNNIGSMAVGAAALGQILDTDAVIQEERINLARLQEEWCEKLRHAEIEISLERAKIARERSQLDEKLRALQQQCVDLAAADQGNEPAKPTRGRWLAKLGLSESEDEQGK